MTTGDILTGILLWDFDGTLAHRDGMWSGALLDALVGYDPHGAWSIDQLRPHLTQGFPWHEPEKEHFEIVDAGSWWTVPLAIFVRASVAAGVPADAAEEVAREARANYISLEKWRLIDGAIEVLSEVRRAGWDSMIVSNHVPELPQIVDGFALGPHVSQVFCSASVGVEKPHPKFFDHVLSNIPRADSVRVIGDSVSADIAGARSAGLPSILIGGESPFASVAVARLRDVPEALRHHSPGSGQ